MILLLFGISQWSGHPRNDWRAKAIVPPRQRVELAVNINALSG
jgi:hypothetical protein